VPALWRLPRRKSLPCLVFSFHLLLSAFPLKRSCFFLVSFQKLCEQFWTLPHTKTSNSTFRHFCCAKIVNPSESIVIRSSILTESLPDACIGDHRRLLLLTRYIEKIVGRRIPPSFPFLFFDSSGMSLGLPNRNFFFPAWPLQTFFCVPSFFFSRTLLPCSFSFPHP